MGSLTINVDDSSFDDTVMSSDKPVLVDFWAVWCGPCRMVAPIMDQLADEFEGKLTVAKVDVDKARQTAGRFGVQSIPTVLLFKNGEVVERIVGAQPKKNFEDSVRNHL